MTLVFAPSQGCGSVSLPSSKSEAHRLLMLAAFTEGVSVIRGVTASSDVAETVAALTALGVKIEQAGDTFTVRGVRPDTLAGSARLVFRHSASTLRFLLPFLALAKGKYELDIGDELKARGIDGYGGALSRLGDSRFSLPADKSSQYASGLMMALSCLPQKSEIVFENPPVSAPYLALTADCICRFGGLAEKTPTGYTVDGEKAKVPRRLAVSPDASAAVPFVLLNALGSKIDLPALPGAQLHADAAVGGLLAEMQKGNAIDLTNAPDLAPCLFAYAALTEGGTFLGTDRLRTKESDRIGRMGEMLALFGAPLTASENSVTVGKITHAPTAPLDATGDHRLAFAASLLLTRYGGELSGAESVEKSFPDYFMEMKKCGFDVKEQ